MTSLLVTAIPLTQRYEIKVAVQREPTAQENRQLAKQMANAYGWTGKQWTCLDTLWGKRESAFRHLLPNKQGSSAYGIAQLLGETSNEPAVQIVRGFRYIKTRFTTPCRALRFHDRHGYY